MLLMDVNVLVYAHRQDAHDHARYRDWLLDLINGPEPFAFSDAVLSGFVRVVTHPRVFVRPTPTRTALGFVDHVRSQPNCVLIAPGPAHWAIFRDLCLKTGAKGNHVPDAWLAALAIEAGCQWITTDRGFARFPRLRWKHPLETD